MTMHLTKNRKGFAQGITYVTQHDEDQANTGISFAILKIAKGESYRHQSLMESAILHLDGELKCTVSGKNYSNQRRSVFDEGPFSLHLPKGEEVILTAVSDVECAIFETANESMFNPVVYQPQDVSTEHRGKGVVGDTSYRYVRTIFDHFNSDASTKLVLGEVVNFPGKWSSYPPHHHSQPEIYHYRFSDPRGYGHAELGEEVVKVRQFDTVKILNHVDHSQCAAPGYGMYYIWVIRHLDGDRYTKPEFTEEHQWVMDPNATYWKGK